MTTTDPVEIMLAHDRWATGNLLEACAALTDEQFHRTFEMGPGSLHDTLTHVLGAMQAWGDMLDGREIRDRLEGEKRSVSELKALHDEIAEDFANSVRSHPPDEMVSGERGGRTYTFARGAVAMHVMTHSMHHRAQCLNMLRHIPGAGAEKLPPSSVIEWVLMGEGNRE